MKIDFSIKFDNQTKAYSNLLSLNWPNIAENLIIHAYQSKGKFPSVAPELDSFYVDTNYTDLYDIFDKNDILNEANTKGKNKRKQKNKKF